jgi:hypothetical protein
MNSLDELITSSEIELMFERADKDKSGSVSFDEFLATMERRAGVVDAIIASDIVLTSDSERICETAAFSMPDWTEKPMKSVEVVETEIAP